ncbi:MAG TPA: M48 family metalloprotease [Candidatus Baltobacteraceae bacterium]|nr:M48 family metalloprotease [Candidatus Baltobacteraceae bacterium]
MFRRAIIASLIFSVACASSPAPARAVTTGSEIQAAKSTDKDVVTEYNIITDPLENAWATEVGERLWTEVARKDVPYNIKVLDSGDINAFTIGGGYIYINEGTLDFAQSDDELAGVIGHETGHNERRHMVTLPAKIQVLNVIFGIASIFSPLIYNFGAIAEAGIIHKEQRVAELQADQYGLFLMTRAGYDPDAMLSFMQHMGALHDEKQSIVDKYFQDHPGVPDRVAHLVGYPQLDPKLRTPDQNLAYGLHDQATARYNISATKFDRVLKATSPIPQPLTLPGNGPGNGAAASAATTTSSATATTNANAPGASTSASTSASGSTAAGSAAGSATTTAQVPVSPEQQREIALLHLGETEIALGQTARSEQTLAEAASSGLDSTKNAANLAIARLRQSQAHTTILHPNIAPLQAQVADAKGHQAEAATAIAARRDPGKDQLKALNERIDYILYGMPNLGNVAARPGSRLESIIKNLEAIGRSLDAAFNKPGEVIAGAGTLQRNKESGLLKDQSDILNELEAPLKLDPIPPQSLALLPSYPRMLSDLQLAESDTIRALDASRSALALLDIGMGDFDTFVKRLTRSQLDGGGDISVMDYTALTPLMQKATQEIGQAAVAGSQAQQLFDLARSRALQTRITMLGLAFPEDRYATLQYALQQRVKNDGVDFETMVRQGLTPGEVAAASIVAADTNTTPSAIIAEARATGKTVIDVANARGMHGRALEMFLGLVYLDYTDDPAREIAGRQ